MIKHKIEIFKEALMTQSNRLVKKALMKVVPTYHTPNEVNDRAIYSEEMRIAVGV